MGLRLLLSKWGLPPPYPRLRRGSTFGAAFSPLVPRSVHSAPKAPPRLCSVHSAPVSCERRRARNFPPASSGLVLWRCVLSGLSKWGLPPPYPRLRRGSSFGAAFSPFPLVATLPPVSPFTLPQKPLLACAPFTPRQKPLLACVCYTCLLNTPNEPLTTARPRSQVNDLPTEADRHGSPAVRPSEKLRTGETKGGIKKRN